MHTYVPNSSLRYSYILNAAGMDVIQPEMLKALEKIKVAWHTYPNCNPNADGISGAVPLD